MFYLNPPIEPAALSGPISLHLYEDELGVSDAHGRHRTEEAMQPLPDGIGDVLQLSAISPITVLKVWDNASSVDRPKHLGQTCAEQHARMPMPKPDADETKRLRRIP